MISVRGITKRFGSHTALDGVELEVPEGTVQGLLGPNGAGKTTTVRVLTTLLQPDSGDAFVAGRSVLNEGHAVRQRLGVSGQYAAVDEKLNGFENLTMVGELYGMRRKDAKARARELLRDFRLDDVPDDKRAGTYSGGMRRRLDLAGAIVARPPVVILDEPTTGLDPRGRRDTWAAIESLASGGTTVLLTTQYLEEADQLADSIAVIDGGRIIAEGTAAELKTQTGGARVDILLAPSSDVDLAVGAVRRAGHEATVDRRAGRLTIGASGGSRDLIDVVEALHAVGLETTEAALRQPTLDEVFLQLTGNSPKSDATVNEPGSPEREPVTAHGTAKESR